MKLHLSLHVMSVLLLSIAAHPTLAQPALDEAKSASVVDQYMQYKTTEIDSVLFSFWEEEEISRAIEARGQAAPLALSRLQSEDMEPPPPEERYIHLQGIVYTTPEQWTVWLNGNKVRPNALPPEAIGFKVYKNYVELKWFDDYTNQIIPLRIRPMQRYNIDTRIFLPG